MTPTFCVPVEGMKSLKGGWRCSMVSSEWMYERLPLKIIGFFMTSPKALAKCMHSWTTWPSATLIFYSSMGLSSLSIYLVSWITLNLSRGLYSFWHSALKKILNRSLITLVYLCRYVFLHISAKEFFFASSSLSFGSFSLLMKAYKTLL